jgi:acyl carrier protein
MNNNENLMNDIKLVIIEALNLEDYKPEDIKSEDPLFGEGLGLDSIDALELGIAIKKHFKIKLDVENNIKEHFYSVEKLSEFIQSFEGAPVED